MVDVVATLRRTPNPPRHGFPRLIVAMIRSDDGVGNFVQNRIGNLLLGCFQAVCYGKRDQLFFVPTDTSAHSRKIERKLPPFFETVHRFVFSDESQPRAPHLFERHGGAAAGVVQVKAPYGTSHKPSCRVPTRARRVRSFWTVPSCKPVFVLNETLVPGGNAAPGNSDVTMRMNARYLV